MLAAVFRILMCVDHWFRMEFGSGFDFHSAFVLFFVPRPVLKKDSC